MWHGREGRKLCIFFRDEGIRDAPGNPDIRIIPNDSGLTGGVVEIAALVKELNGIGQARKPCANPCGMKI